MDQTVGSNNPSSNLPTSNSNSDADAGYGNSDDADADVDSPAGSLMIGTQAAQVFLDYTTYSYLLINLFLAQINTRVVYLFLIIILIS